MNDSNKLEEQLEALCVEQYNLSRRNNEVFRHTGQLDLNIRRRSDEVSAEIIMIKAAIRSRSPMKMAVDL